MKFLILIWYWTQGFINLKITLDEEIQEKKLSDALPSHVRVCSFSSNTKTMDAASGQPNWEKVEINYHKDIMEIRLINWVKWHYREINH